MSGGERVDETLLPEMDVFFQLPQREEPDVYPVGDGRWAYTLPRGRGTGSGYTSEEAARSAALTRAGGAA